MKDRALFLRNLKGWTPHVLLSALPSFALAYSQGFDKAQSVVGMVAGILVFLFLYPAVWGSGWFRRRVPEGSAWEWALTYGARGRSFFGVAAAILLLTSLVTSDHTHKNPPAFIVALIVFLTPDFFSGILSGLFIDWATRSPLVRAVRVAIGGTDAHERGQSLVVGDVNSLLPTFITTLVQGLLLTLMLVLFALACRGCMWLNQRWKSRRKPSLIPAAALT